MKKKVSALDFVFIIYLYASTWLYLNNILNAFIQTTLNENKTVNCESKSVKKCAQC